MRLTETITFDGAEFIEENGHRTVKNVVMLGPVSLHGYEYEQPAMAKAVRDGLYEGARCFINHREGSRDIMDLAGVFRHIRHEGGKVRGDAHLLDDERGRKFWAIAKDMPEAASCSHVADGKLVTKNGKRVVEEITKVHSVDLVIQGATTKSIFESSAADEIDSFFGGVLKPQQGETQDQFSARVQEEDRAIALLLAEGDDDPGPDETKRETVSARQPAERTTTMQTLNEQLDALDQQRENIIRLADPLFQGTIQKHADAERDEEYEARRQQRRDEQKRLEQITADLDRRIEAGQYRETDEEFTERLADRRRLREE